MIIHDKNKSWEAVQVPDYGDHNTNELIDFLKKHWIEYKLNEDNTLFIKKSVIKNYWEKAYPLNWITVDVTEDLEEGVIMLKGTKVFIYSNPQFEKYFKINNNE